ncbi:putative checkpoint protein kinase [Rhizophagus clarus]|uniref:Putative checkpoint protein kinase n=1 Tax=Rhizophagus clarus TaxID=94130 RepID=A0A8H3MBS3_9GLOM|nr:putative checkpoint protein kinase [Rhizophagus clarus]
MIRHKKVDSGLWSLDTPLLNDNGFPVMVLLTWSYDAQRSPLGFSTSTDPGGGSVNVENEVTKKKRKLTKKQTERLKTCNNTFKIELENIDELDDSFDVYVRYIKWTMANYSQTPGSRSRLHQLLENASYRFHVENLKVLFAFLNRNEIGLNLAIYYEEYAEILEAMKCYNR